MFGPVSGATITIYGVAQLTDKRFPKWLGLLGFAAGLFTLVGGTAMAYSHFSATTMLINMSAGVLVALWMVALGIFVGVTPAVSTTTREIK
jgi:hypothetical protein